MNWKAPVLQISRSQHARRVYAALSGTPILGGFLRRLVRGGCSSRDPRLAPNLRWTWEWAVGPPRPAL